jgi:hypothetical protein
MADEKVLKSFEPKKETGKFPLPFKLGSETIKTGGIMSLLFTLGHRLWSSFLSERRNFFEN